MRFLCFLILTLLVVAMPGVSKADFAPAKGLKTLTDEQRMDLARQFLAKVKPNLESASQQQKIKKDKVDLSKIPEGEDLFFRIRLTKDIALDYQLLANIQKGRLIISFNDFVNAVEFPIVYNPKQGTATGWYIREKKNFSLDLKARQVVTDKGTYKMSDAVTAKDDDIYLPADELAQWFDISLEPDVPFLELDLKSATKLPIQEQAERRDRKFSDEYDIPKPSLPPLEADKQKAIAVPLVDVTTFSSYTRPGDGSKPSKTQSAGVRTSGDFLYGNLTTQSQFTKENRLTSLRATYSKESLTPDLLGPLKARLYEIGDTTPVDIPLSDRYASGQGFRVTNKDPLRNVIGASTIITGPSLPGWDVELYRGEQLLGFQTVGDNGIYTFPDVELYGSDNTFRVVMYGLQGEQREEEVYIPVDPNRLADEGSAYDISIVRQDTPTYAKFKNQDDDAGSPSLTALYELPVGDDSALTAGFVTRKHDGEDVATGSAGVSTSILETLWNLNGAVDDKGETAAELITRKDFKEHQFRNELRWATDKFGEQDEVAQSNLASAFTLQPFSFEREVFGDQLSANGPLNWGFGIRPQYNLSLDYSESSDSLSNLNAVAGYSTRFKKLSYNQQFIYNRNDANLDGDKFNTITNLNGSLGKNRVRLSADYQIMPDPKLERVSTFLNRTITPTMDGQLGLMHNLDTRLTEVSAQLNWDTGFGNLSPGITYNSDKDFIATLTTRFGLAQDPLSGKPKIFDQSITSNGGVSAFVFLDKDGDGIFDKDDEPIPDAIIKAPQNGGREITDEKGNAFFSRMGALRLTDVYVDPESLADPYWIPAYEGASVLPREGHVTAIQFPVHISGEMDGTLYLKTASGDSLSMKGVSLGLYDKNGKRIQNTKSEQDGYYIFSRIPPGTYYLVVDDTRLKQDQSRPLPQQVTIDYKGTTIYANNIYIREGQPDVPLAVLAGGLPYDAKKVEPYKDRDFALNLGQYKSRLSMGLAWFKVRATSAASLEGSDLIEKPSESTPVPKNGYTLRVSLKDNNLESAYKKCARIVSEGNFCALEIMPGGLTEKVAAK